MNLDSVIERRWFDAVRNLEYGTLHFTTPNGETTTLQGPKPGPVATLKIHEWDVLRRAASRGDIGLGEDYIDGAWDSENVEALFALFLMNMDAMDGFAHGNLINRIGFVLTNTFFNRNSVKGSSRNIQAHYDVGNDFYKLWLDETMTYSSALFDKPDLSLADAQRRKYGRILSKFNRDKANVLEIGCGWGGFAEAAAAGGHEVTGLTVSPAQAAFARERLNGAAEVKLEDYRHTKGAYDMIVSIEMFEAVGERYWKQFFHVLSERLKRSGRAVIQTITIRDELFSGYRTRSDFIRHYVFPGGMLPSVQRFQEEAERAGLKVADKFSFGQDYARTLRQWSERLSAREAEVKALGHTDAFMRNWKFYIGICAAAFAVNRTDVVQLELAHA